VHLKKELRDSQGIRPYVRTTINPNFDERLKNILNRNLNPLEPNIVWVTDRTYCYTLSGVVYLASVMELYSRKIVGGYLSDSLSSEGVTIGIDKDKRARILDIPIVYPMAENVSAFQKRILKQRQLISLSKVILRKEHFGTMCR
jgi:putative transposase